MNLFDIGKPYFKFSKSRDNVRWFSTFSGVGMQEMGLKRVTSNYEMLGFSEIDKHAIKSYHAIHGKDIKNYGDIMNIKGDLLPKNIDFFTFSFPCTDISNAGKKEGLTSETRSGLVFEVLRLLDELKSLDNLPKVLLMENVPMLLSKKFKDGWHKIYNEIEALGYSNFVDVLNSDDYGVAQTRERVFMVSILGDYQYQFPKPFPLEKRLKNYLEKEVDEKYFISDKMMAYFTDMTDRNGFVRGKRFNPHPPESKYAYTITTSGGNRPTDNFIIVPEKTIRGYKEAEDGDGVYINRPHQKRGGVQKGKIQTLKTSPNDVGVVVKDTRNLKEKLADDLIESGAVKGGEVINHSYAVSRTTDRTPIETTDGIMPTLTTRLDTLGVVVNQPPLRIRKLTPLEAWRLMDISDEDFYKVKETGMSDAQLYKQAGNGIVVSVVEHILKELFDE